MNRTSEKILKKAFAEFAPPKKEITDAIGSLETQLWELSSKGDTGTIDLIYDLVRKSIESARVHSLKCR